MSSKGLEDDKLGFLSMPPWLTGSTCQAVLCASPAKVTMRNRTFSIKARNYQRRP
jgi:hypothetical protein